MSVDFHRHCQKTVLTASGTQAGNGMTWSTISDLGGELANLPSGWVDNYFLNNTDNITQDFNSVLRLMDATTGTLKTDINGTKSRLTTLEGKVSTDEGKVQTIEGQIRTINSTLTEQGADIRDHDARLIRLEGQEGQLNNIDIICFIAPNEAYFDSQSGFTRHIDENNRTYFTLNSYSTTAPKCSYSYDTASEHRIYPGNDNNLESQYSHYSARDGGANEQRAYPVFSLNAAMRFLMRFRAAGGIKYYVRTQYGDYDFGTNVQDVRLADARAGSELIIGPNQTQAQRQALAGTQQNYDYTAIWDDGNPKFKDSDLVSVRFIWNDDNNTKYSDWCNTIRFYDSITSIIGCGFKLEWRRFVSENYNSTSMSYQAIQVKSGSVTFRQCVFRNARFFHNIADTPPTIKFMFYPVLDVLPTDNTQYSQESISQYQLPCVFVDDPPLIGVDDDHKRINYDFIDQADNENSSLIMFKAYNIYLNRRSHQPIRTQASDKITFHIGYDGLSKQVICALDSDSAKAPPFTLTELSSARSSQASSPSNASNPSYRQFRIEYINRASDDIPNWLTGPTTVFSPSHMGLDATKVIYNTVTTKIVSTPFEIYYNGMALVQLDSQGGSGGATHIWIKPNTTPPSLSGIPTRAGYAFDGYYTKRNGGGIRLIDGSGNIARWLPEYPTKLYANWTQTTTP